MFSVPTCCNSLFCPPLFLVVVMYAAADHAMQVLDWMKPAHIFPPNVVLVLFFLLRISSVLCPLSCELLLVCSFLFLLSYLPPAFAFSRMRRFRSFRITLATRRFHITPPPPRSPLPGGGTGGGNTRTPRQKPDRSLHRAGANHAGR